MTSLDRLSAVHPIIKEYIRVNPIEGADTMPVWDYLNEVRRQLQQTLTIPRPIVALMREKDLLRFLPDIKLFEARLKQAETDIMTFVEEYRLIASRHATRTGHATDLDDKADVFQINELYTLLSQRASVAIEEVLCHLIDMLNQAQVRYVAYHQQHNLPYRENYINEVIEAWYAEHAAQATDPSVVTDVPYSTAPAKKLGF